MVKKTHVFSLVASLILFFGRANAQVEPFLYELLGVPSTATSEAIKIAYRQKALEFHPDKNPNNPLAAEKFKQVATAYSILSDKTNRSLYDQGWTVQEIEDPTLRAARAAKDAAGRRRSDDSKDRSSPAGYGSFGKTFYPSDAYVDQDWKSEYKKYTNASASRSSFTSNSFAGGKDQWMKEWHQKQQRQYEDQQRAKDAEMRSAHEERLRQKQAELEAIRAELARRQSTEQSSVKATQAASWQANLSAVHKGSKVASTAKKPNSSSNEINQELTRLRAKKQRMLKSLKGASPDEIDEVLADDPDMQRLIQLEQAL